jgi:hypothetical protein
MTTTKGKSKRQPKSGNKTKTEKQPALSKVDPLFVLSVYPLIVKMSKGYVAKVYETILKSLNIPLDGDENEVSAKVLDEIHPAFFAPISEQLTQSNPCESMSNGILILSKEGVRVMLQISNIPDNITDQIVDDDSLWQDIFQVSLKILQSKPV